MESTNLRENQEKAECSSLLSVFSYDSAKNYFKFSSCIVNIMLKLVHTIPILIIPENFATTAELSLVKFHRFIDLVSIF